MGLNSLAAGEVEEAKKEAKDMMMWRVQGLHLMSDGCVDCMLDRGWSA